MRLLLGRLWYFSTVESSLSSQLVPVNIHHKLNITLPVNILYLYSVCCILYFDLSLSNWESVKLETSWLILWEDKGPSLSTMHRIFNQRNTTINIARGTTDPCYWVSLSYIFGSKFGKFDLNLVPILASRWSHLYRFQV